MLLIRALLGLGLPGGADAQVSSLLQDYPYDAQIHFAIDQVIDAQEARSGNIVDRGLAFVLSRLCNEQQTATLPLLESGKALDGKDISASPSILFSDAIRCAALPPELRDAGGQDTMRRLTAIANQPNWAGTADLAPMQAALARQKMVGARVPLKALHAHVLSNSNLTPRELSLTRGTVLLLPFTLWAPSAQDVVGDLTKLAPQQPIYAITSWSANTGRDDVASNEISTALRLWQQTKPSHVTLLIVPDTELNAFHADSFPAGIVIRDGVVRWNCVLSGRGAEHMLLRAMTDHNLMP